jgi:hypothetical protein
MLRGYFSNISLFSVTLLEKQIVGTEILRRIGAGVLVIKHLME